MGHYLVTYLSIIYFVGYKALYFLAQGFRAYVLGIQLYTLRQETQENLAFLSCLLYAHDELCACMYGCAPPAGMRRGHQIP